MFVLHNVDAAGYAHKIAAYETKAELDTYITNNGWVLNDTTYTSTMTKDELYS